jgi:hypothetical protein
MRIILVVMLVVVFTLGLSGIVLAAETDTIVVTATPVFLAIDNSPDTWTVNGCLIPAVGKEGDGKTRKNTTYYSNPLGDLDAPAAAQVVDGECQFTITNTSNVITDITVNFPDFAGGDFMINSNAGTNGVGTFGAWCWYSGMTYANKVIAKAAGSDPLIVSLAATTNKKFGIEVKTQTDAFLSATAMTSSVVIAVTEH